MSDPLESALRSAWNNSEPDMPECHLCGDQAGPWVPEPSGDRWPSGAQKLVCKGGCQTTAEASESVASADVPPAKPRRRAPLSVRMDDTLAADLAVMARAGMTASDAARTALSIVAGTYANAWAAGVVPEGVQPEITACSITAYDVGARP